MPQQVTDRVPRLGTRRRGTYILVVAGIVAVLAVFLLTERLSRAPHSVPNLTVDNTTAYEVTVTASATPTGAVTPIGIVPAGRSLGFTDVIDEGGVWYFHLSAQGVDAGTVAVTRADLISRGWHVALGADVGRRILAQDTTTAAAAVPAG